MTQLDKDKLREILNDLVYDVDSDHGTMTLDKGLNIAIKKIEELRTQELALAKEEGAREERRRIRDIMIDEDFLYNMPPIPAWYGTKHGTQERGELVATKRFMEQLPLLTNPSVKKKNV